VMIYIARAISHKSASSIENSTMKKDFHQGAKRLLVGVMLTLVAGFVLMPFGADPSGRYFLPLAIPLSLFASALILELKKRYNKIAYGLVALLMVYYLLGIIQSALRFPPGVTTQFYAPTRVDHRYDDELIEFLHKEGENRGYSNYWVAYPLAFLSHEELIFTPRLPYHLDFRYTERDNRYPPYEGLVAQADRVAYITTNHPELEDYLREKFDQLNVSWKELRIGSYHIFYHLSQTVRPVEIGLGETTNP